MLNINGKEEEEWGTVNSNSFLLTNGEILTGESRIENGTVGVKNGEIIEVSAGLLEQKDESYEVIQLDKGDRIIPGMIDVHIHGAAGADVMDASFEALQAMANVLPKEGTTSFLATTMTERIDRIDAALENAGHYMNDENKAGKAEILGVHLEGPFLSTKRAGAQPVEHIIERDLDLFKKWNQLANHAIRLVTYAPEEDENLEFTHYLRQAGIIASIGHSDALYDGMMSAIQAGASHVTHLYNGMRGLHHREPGVLGTALIQDELTVEIIADGVHIRPEMIRLAYQQKGKDKIILITDSMEAKWLGSGTYDLGSQEVTVADGKATLPDGTLAGSILKMNKAAQNMIEFTGCFLEDVVQMASVNPARQIGVFDRKGSISAGKDADLVVLDHAGEVKMTFCRGKLAYKRGE
jgi:N-acetylglucosamine-6-phosphate deacetylase